MFFFFFFQAEDGIRDVAVTGVQTCALPISDPPRLKRPARLAHLNVLESGAPEAVVEEHVRGAGVGGIRLPALVARVPFGPARTRRLLGALAAAGRVTAVGRGWSLHAGAGARLRGRVTPAPEPIP